MTVGWILPPRFAISRRLLTNTTTVFIQPLPCSLILFNASCWTATRLQLRLFGIVVNKTNLTRSRRPVLHCRVRQGFANKLTDTNWVVNAVAKTR